MEIIRYETRNPFASKNPLPYKYVGMKEAGPVEKTGTILEIFAATAPITAAFSAFTNTANGEILEGISDARNVLLGLLVVAGAEVIRHFGKYSDQTIAGFKETDHKDLLK